jgi:type I restriction enzyme M protein
MNKQQLASKIWSAANKMRSKIEANEYKDYILGFIFYKFLSDKEVEALKDDGWEDADLKELTEDDADTVADLQQRLGYFIAYDNLYSTWVKSDKDREKDKDGSFSVKNVTDALNAFNRLIGTTHKRVFNKIFDTLQIGIGKLGDTDVKKTKAIKDLLDLIKDIPTDSREDYDVLGFIYEYLISNFAANAGKKAGEFYTPHEVAVLMAEIVAHNLQGKKNIEIYDPTSGSASLLLNIGKAVAKHTSGKNSIKYYAQELKEATYNLTRMNLVMRGITPDNIVVRNGDTLEDDWPYFDEGDRERTYNPLYVNAVVSNPPYSQAWDPKNKGSDRRFKDYGVAPKGKADYAFLLHDLYHVKPDGVMTIVLPHGVLFRGGEEETIRTKLVERNNIDAIIGLPAGIFFGTGIPTIVMVLKQKRENSDVLIIDASKGFVKDGKNNKLRACDIKKIVDVVINRESVPKFSRVVSRDEIRDNGYNLNIPRYVDSSDETESWDIYASMFGGIPNSEIDALDDYWKAFPSLKAALFKQDKTPFSSLAVDDIRDAVNGNADVQKFVKAYGKALKDYPGYLKAELVDKMMKVDVAKAETATSDTLFADLAKLPLVDKYQAYQILNTRWQQIATDLEILQTEGFEAATVVDPNMVIKKKDGKEEEVQDGWVGHVIPFDLVQRTLLKKDADELAAKQAELDAVDGEFAELVETFNEDEDGPSYLNDDNTDFNGKEITAKAKAIVKSKAKYDDDSIEAKVMQVNGLMERAKQLKKAIKALSSELQVKTKETIEGLDKSQVLELIEMKWVNPVYESLLDLPTAIIDGFVSKVMNLAEKYATTYHDVNVGIRDAQKELGKLLGDLTGDAFDMKGIDELKGMLK